MRLWPIYLISIRIIKILTLYLNLMKNSQIRVYSFDVAANLTTVVKWYQTGSNFYVLNQQLQIQKQNATND